MKVLYTGSFNPFHNGHQYVYDVACKCFGKENVWIGIGKNSGKNDIDIEHLRFSIVPITKNVLAYNCLTAEIVKKEHFDLLIRGVRPGRSLEDENDLLYWNRKLGGVETILIPTPPEVNQISSGAIRELNKYEQDVSSYINEYVYARWKNKSIKQNIYFGKCCSGKSTYLKHQYGNCFGEWAHTEPIECDKVLFDFLKEDAGYNKDLLTATLKDLFYKKDSNFLITMNNVAKNIDWDRFFTTWYNYDNSYGFCFDMPVIGSYWKHIPIKYLARLRLIKISTSDENRLLFSNKRMVNPMLIECNDFFYQDPPFWDEEIIIDKKK